eukprot:3501639-Rhodomonas_salina.4
MAASQTASRSRQAKHSAAESTWPPRGGRGSWSWHIIRQDRRLNSEGVEIGGGACYPKYFGARSQVLAEPFRPLLWGITRTYSFCEVAGLRAFTADGGSRRVWSPATSQRG